MDDLAAFLAPLDAEPAGEDRHAARAGVDAAAWLALRALDGIEQLRAIHRAVIGERPRVRRADGDGRWTVSPSAPGQWRTKPQCLRIGEHVEPAWPPGAIAGRLPAILDERDPDAVRDAARVIAGLARAQPFAGENERVARLAASLRLRAAGLPALPPLDDDPGYRRALAAAGEGERDALERRLAAAIRDEALVHVEWVPPAGPIAILAAEHRALEQARAAAPSIAEAAIDELGDRAAAALPGALAALRVPGPGAAERRWRRAATDRLAAAWDAARRGRVICPHRPVLELRWALDGTPGLAAVLVLGAAGRGVTGAWSAHLSVELPVPHAGPAPGLLLLPGEAAAARAARLEAWIGGAAADAVARAPLGL